MITCDRQVAGRSRRILVSMRRMMAFLSYYVGLMLGLGVVLDVARDADTWQLFFVPVYAFPIWWIAAGIAIRLGVYPSEFFRKLATAAGLIEPRPVETDIPVER